MSRARKRLKRERKRDALGKSISAHCTVCGVQLPKAIYELDDPLEYHCPICGKLAFGELKELWEKNKDLKISIE